MKHVRVAGLVKEDMRMVVDIVPKSIITNMIKKSEYIREYKINPDRDELIHFLQNGINTVIIKGPVKKFYRTLNDKVLHMQLKLREVDENYEEILKSKKLRDLRSFFAKIELEPNEIKAIPILLKCMEIEQNNNIIFMIENEIYIRRRIEEKIDNSKQIKNNEENNIVINKLLEEIKTLEERIRMKNNTILTLDNINKELQLELDSQDTEIGYFEELTSEDYTKILKDLGEHSSQIKKTFKNLVQEFEESGSNSNDKLYEMWMKWTDDEVTVMDRVLKKSIYEEKILRSDINDLEDMSENIMSRHLLLRLVLHLIYRRMSSQCFEEAMTF